MSNESDKEVQSDELEALASIYGGDFTLHDPTNFEIRICCDEEKWWAVTIAVVLPDNYPSQEPPLFEIHTECLSQDEIENIYAVLAKKWADCAGGAVLYCWVEKIREMLVEKYELAKLFIESSEEDRKRELEITQLMRESEEIDSTVITSVEQLPPLKNVPEILSGETTTLKKSTFQGHVAIVTSKKEVKLVLRKLKENRKVAQASHNIVAYRICGATENSFIQDYADDGEVNAGGRLLHLLQIMNVKNIVVVVSRWYGGILLGPDRFRLISNAAREVIVKSGAYTPKQEKKHKKK